MIKKRNMEEEFERAIQEAAIKLGYLGLREKPEKKLYCNS